MNISGDQEGDDPAVRVVREISNRGAELETIDTLTAVEYFVEDADDPLGDRDRQRGRTRGRDIAVALLKRLDFG